MDEGRGRIAVSGGAALATSAFFLIDGLRLRAASCSPSRARISAATMGAPTSSRTDQRTRSCENEGRRVADGGRSSPVRH